MYRIAHVIDATHGAAEAVDADDATYTADAEVGVGDDTFPVLRSSMFSPRCNASVEPMTTTMSTSLPAKCEHCEMPPPHRNSEHSGMPPPHRNSDHSGMPPPHKTALAQAVCKASL